MNKVGPQKNSKKWWNLELESVSETNQIPKFKWTNVKLFELVPENIEGSWAPKFFSKRGGDKMK